MKDQICLTLGENIKKYRKLRGLTQEKLAEALEMEIKSLSLIETGNCFVSSKTLSKLSNILQVAPSSLLDDANSNDTKKLYSDIQKALELIKNNPAKLRALNSILNGLL
ncbi:helix-turn-helix transcriptional regulator [bacterium]|nr:helix-turn-helix transcriptional regulator [bacterium]